MEDVLVSPGGQLSGFAKACPCLRFLGVKIKIKKNKNKTTTILLIIPPYMQKF